MTAWARLALVLAAVGIAATIAVWRYDDPGADRRARLVELELEIERVRDRLRDRLAPLPPPERELGERV